jgi:hypothetical protein
MAGEWIPDDEDEFLPSVQWTAEIAREWRDAGQPDDVLLRFLMEGLERALAWRRENDGW